MRFPVSPAVQLKVCVFTRKVLFEHGGLAQDIVKDEYHPVHSVQVERLGL